MSDKIKPSEVSQVLLEQLKGINNSQQFDEVGTVLEVSDGVARIYGLRNAEANELLEFENGTMAIVMNLEEDNVGCVLLGSTEGIKEGMVVKRTKRIASIRVNDNMLGRVINPLGQAIDGKGEIDLTESFEMPLDRKAPGVIYRQRFGRAHRRQGRYSRKGNTPHRKDCFRYHHQKAGNSSVTDRYQGDRQHDPDRQRSA